MAEFWLPRLRSSRASGARRPHGPGWDGFQGLEIVLRAIAGTGGQLARERPGRRFHGLDHRLQLVLAAAALGQPMGHDHLMSGIAAAWAL